MKTIIQSLSTKTAYRLAFLGWIILALYAIFFMAPSVNDGLYLNQSLATFHHWIPGTWIGNKLYPTFFDMPTFPFINGLFYKLMSIFGIMPGPYTFRLFAVLCVFALLFLMMKLIDKLAPKNQNMYFIKTVVLICLALSPFVIACWDLRPEVLGLSLLTASILAFLTNRSLLCGLCLGLAAIMHPLIALYAFMIGLGYLLNLCSERRYKTLLMIIGTALIPCILFAIWFWINSATAIPQLFGRTETIAPGGSNSPLRGVHYILRYMNPFSNEDTSLVALYYAIFYWMLIPLIVAFVVLFRRQIWKSTLTNIKLWLPIALTLASIIVLFSVQMYGTYLLNITYALILSITCFTLNRKTRRTEATQKTVPANASVMIAVLLLASFSAWAQATKFLLTNKTYYQANTTRRAVTAKLESEDSLIITGQRLLPPFANTPRVHCVFCAGAGQLPATIWNKESSEYIYNDLAKQDPKHLVWGIMKQDILYSKDNEICFMLKGFPAAVLLSKGVAVFQDSDNLFYRPAEMWIGKPGQTCQEMAELPSIPSLR